MINFWDFSASIPQADAQDGSPALVVPPDTPAEQQVAEDVAEPSRDEVIDISRGDQEGESRDEEKTEAHRNQTGEPNPSDVSMFSTLTELLFTPFVDGYCRTPFCSDADYLPPSCPSGNFYTTTKQPNPYLTGPNPIKPQQDYITDEFGDICRSNSAASSAHTHSSSQARRRRQRPLAFAVGHGDEWKDLEGRRVVITPRRAHQQTSPTRLSPYRYRPPQPATCTCTTPESNNSLALLEHSNVNPNVSPHKTKAVLCKYCARLQDLEVPPSYSSGTISSHPPPPHPMI